MADTSIACQDDGAVMVRSAQADVPDGTGQFLLYECPTCGRKAGLVYQAKRGLSEHAQGWIENELRTNGFVFPSDFTGSNDRGGPRGW